MKQKAKPKENAAQQLNKAILPDKRSGSLQRNNVYSADAVRDWAWRIRSGPGGIKLNQKFMLIALATNVSGRAVVDMPTRYLGDHIGVGLRQAQRIIGQLIGFKLVIPTQLDPDSRPNDMARTYRLNTTLDADTWTPAQKENPLMPIYRARLHDWYRAHVISDDELQLLLAVHLLGVRSKRLDFVSPNVEVTNTVFHFKKRILAIVEEATKTTVDHMHLIPRKGYRD